jgi:hypothetical protein
MRVSLLLVAALVAAPALAADKPEPSAVARRIDHHVGAKLAAAKVPPAPLADDAMFLRRTYLLLVGRIPMPSEVHAFLEDTDPARRAKVIDRLLASPAYANHFTTVWRGWLLPEALTSFEVAALTPAFEVWLRKQLVANVAYDKLVTELLTVPVAQPRNRPAPPINPEDQTPFGIRGGPLVFYYAKEAKAENLAAATARLFLGVQLDCAQCHDHPFAKWSRDQFWGLAGFFAGIEQTQPNNFFGPLREVLDRREMLIPNTDRVVQATFLDDKEPEWKARTSGRVTLAEWITAKNNEFFARATANRVWWYVFGTGLYEPVDDFTDEHLPSHPEMLDELAKAFADSGFDLKFLLKAILLSETYQRDSAMTAPGQTDPRLFARFPVQGMTPEQLYDSLSLIASAGQEPAGGAYLQNPGSPKRQFVDKFNLIGGKTESPSSILQALTLMNGELVNVATQPGQSRPVGVVTSLPGLTDEERVDVLYLTALGRRPKPAELERALKHVRAGEASPENLKRRYGDLLWALLNTAEFRTNH